MESTGHCGTLTVELHRNGGLVPIFQSGDENTGENLQNQWLDKILKHNTKSTIYKLRKESNSLNTHNHLDGYQGLYAE